MARKQRDLLSPPPLDVQPASGSTEPRLWVRRLAIWSEPRTKVREILLRPGLNIVWSPDAADLGRAKKKGSTLGHGSGKTLFCRLLRYCLGEDRFAPDGLRGAIASAFKDGLVGAEVVLDGRTWAIVRPLAFARRTIAVCDGDLDELAAGTGPSTGMAPFLAAIERAILPDAVAALAPAGKEGGTWLTALAWLSRDQECRFDGVLDWRSAASESGSPVRPLADADRLEALRSFLRALTTEELALRREVNELETRRDGAVRERGLRSWAVTQQRHRLAARLSLSPGEEVEGPLAIDFFRKHARERLAAVAVVSTTGAAQDLDSLRSRYQESRDAYERVSASLAGLDAAIPEQEEVVRLVRGEASAFTFRAHRAENPSCPVCEVPLDRVLMEGCKLSQERADLEQVRARRDQLTLEVEKQTARLEAAKDQRDQIASQLAQARQAAESTWQALSAAERAGELRRDVWYEARQCMDEVDRLGEAQAAAERATGEVDRLDTEIEKKRERIRTQREQQSKVFRQASKHFDAIVRELIGEEAEGRVTLDGKGLHLGIELGGDRSTAAIESLKVLAFDVAAMCMSIEGRTQVPAFLVHDSPREADLGQSIYNRVFDLIRRLEKIGRRPLFQYIITTTTKPPEEVCTEPWLAATLEGTPAEKRLLARNL